MKKIIFAITLCFLACSKSEAPLSTENIISDFRFQIEGKRFDGVINQETNTITVDLVDADLSALRPYVTISESASVSPSSRTAQDFNQEVKYTVVAENGNTKTYTIIIKNEISSSENKISEFVLSLNGENIQGEINHDAFTIVFDVIGADLESLSPSISIPESASIVPSPGSVLDFNERILFTVKAANGDIRYYTVTVNNRPFSTGSDMLSFSVELDGEQVQGLVDEDSQQIIFNTGSVDISSLTPEIMASENATIYPEVGTPLDFNNPVTYTITAENGETKQYSVLLNSEYYIRTGPQLYYIRATINFATIFLDPELPGVEFYLFDGETRIDLPVEFIESYEVQRKITYNISALIPENTPSSTGYNIFYKLNDFIYESEFAIDVLAEGAPNITSVNQDLYSIGDTLIITGENLVENIGVRSNGYFYSFKPTSNIVTSLNNEKTEYKLLLDGSFTKSAFFESDILTREIIFMGPDFRFGQKISVNVNN